MKTACIAASRVPSGTANSIQVMKVCHAISQVAAPAHLWLPGETRTPWEEIAVHYGLTRPFEISWLSSPPWMRRYDFTWRSLANAQRWGAQRVYTWLPQAALLALRRALPVILELHDRVTGHLAPWIFRQFIQAPGQKRLLVITEALLERLEAQFGSLAGLDIQIAPNGVELEQYADLPEAQTARFRLGLPEKMTAVYSGHFYAGRGVSLLVELAVTFPQISFIWVGGRPVDVGALKKQLERQNIRNVLLTGFIPNSQLPLYQAAADILLMPYERSIAGSSGGNSAEICSPMKMFDYLAAGRAILSSDLPVFHEVLNPQNAVFCPPEDPAGWKSALAALLQDPVRQHQLGEQARQDALHYSWRKRAERALLNFA
ncbi:MAG: glycosyltransferase [Anaerolineaceae bacterium]|nr:glycosyltransferase [Anaerolineaceae bacterium]